MDIGTGQDTAKCPKLQVTNVPRRAPSPAESLIYTGRCHLGIMFVVLLLLDNGNITYRTIVAPLLNGRVRGVASYLSGQSQHN
mmetsp:Transcript_2491/g.7447  ORF Transcript_2491/g.7447 Transcript_2491/m.7447 type:complete len:83 (-) Transcript_2491:1354-1602(-)